MAIDFRAVPAFCINLDTRADRWARAQEEFARVGWSVARWPGVVYPRKFCYLPKEHAGCLDAHRALWQKCVKENLPVMAVFEDDIVLPSDFIDIFNRASSELPGDWALWHLHSSHAHTEPLSAHLVRIVSRLWGTHGYLIRPAACAALLTLPGYAAVDFVMTHSYRALGGQPIGTALPSTLCFQRGEDSDIPSSAQLRYWQQQRAKYCR
jgi:hypothetical protein